jgi:WD40 repeat protein
MSVQRRLREAYERTPSPGPAEAGAYGRFLRRRARSVRTVTAATVLLLALAGLAPRLLGGQDRRVVRPVPAGPALIARFTADGPFGRAVAFSPDARTLAVAGRHRISLWDLDRHVRTVLTTPEVPFASEAIAFAPDGRTLAAGAGLRVVLWDLASRTRRASLPTGMAGNVRRLAFSPDGRVLAASGDDYRDGGKLVVWDVARRARLAILPTGIGSINDLAFRQDGRSVVVAGSASVGGSYGVGDPVPVDAVTVDLVRRRSSPAVRMQAGLESSPAVAYRPDGTALAAVGDPLQHVALWDVTRRAHLVTMAGRDPVTRVVLSRGGGLLAMARPDGEVTLWDFGRHVRLGPLPGFHPLRREFSLSPQTCTFTSDGRRLAISDGTGSVFVWSTSNP